MTAIKSFKGRIVQEIQLNIDNTDKSQSALVRARYYDASPTSEWDVILYGIPRSDL
jgi:hypothetical protein